MNTSAAATNPFSNDEKENFPNFDAVFESDKMTPNTDQKSTFRWSIDQIARLKPVDIGTSPSTLAHHIMSPTDDLLSQEESDKFFSQKFINPSPWLQAKTQSKHVTFSPHPPETAYFKKDESANIQSDASTQTTLSIPLDFDLEKVLGSALYGFDQDTSFNLRRKLFGEPTRQDDTDEDNDGCHDNSPFDESSNETSQDTQLSSTPLRSPFTPNDIMNTDSYNMMASSFVVADNEAPPSLSPIGNELQTPQKTTPPDPLLNLSPITEQSVLSSENGLKPILKRHYHGSPHWPEVKHYCNYRPSEDDDNYNSSSGSSSEGGGIGEEGEGITPSLLSLTDLQDMPPTASTACTTYFNSLELLMNDESKDNKPSITTLWHPPITSTMIKHSTAPPASITDSGYGTTEANNDMQMLSFGKTTIPEETTDYDLVCHSTDSGEGTYNDKAKFSFPQSLLPSRFKLPSSSMTPPSRHYSTTVGTDPTTKDLIRRKNVLKAKLNVVNLD